MIDIGAIIYVLIRALMRRRLIRIHSIKRLFSFMKIAKIHDALLIFTFLKDDISPVLNAKMFMKKVILVNSAWAAQIILYDNEKTHNAFLITIGHELMHKYDCKITGLDNIEKKFINWVTEVYCDFGGAKLMVESDRKKLVDSATYKKEQKKEAKKKTFRPIRDIDTFDHPSWEHRAEYAQNYDFDETLIRKIAEDTGCTNEKLIQSVCVYYKPIKLV